MNDQQDVNDMYHHHDHHSTGPGGAVLHAMGQIDTNSAAHANPFDSAIDSNLLHDPNIDSIRYSVDTNSAIHPNLLDYPLNDTESSQPSTGQSIDTNAATHPNLLNDPTAPPSTTIITATNATVAITTSAPSIPGIGKINPSRFPPKPKQPHQKIVIVPTYSCNGGLDVKFDPSPRRASPSHLHNLLSPEEYEGAIDVLNDTIKRYRNNALDVACLATGPLMIPLVVWGMRRGRSAKGRKGEIERAVREFNERMEMEGRNVGMFWNKAGKGGVVESFLSIEEVEPSVERGRGIKKGAKLD